MPARLFFMESRVTCGIRESGRHTKKPLPEGRGLAYGYSGKGFRAYPQPYFTAPATALVKLFCRQKKMMTVGSEQIVTPAMTTP